MLKVLLSACFNKLHCLHWSSCRGGTPVDPRWVTGHVSEHCVNAGSWEKGEGGFWNFEHIFFHVPYIYSLFTLMTKIQLKEMKQQPYPVLVCKSLNVAVCYRVELQSPGTACWLLGMFPTHQAGPLKSRNWCDALEQSSRPSCSAAWWELCVCAAVHHFVLQDSHSAARL